MITVSKIWQQELRNALGIRVAEPEYSKQTYEDKIGASFSPIFPSPF
jgi:hypothetical protein